MKDIKSVMIGFLLATSMFLFMGQTKATNSEIGRYQISITTGDSGHLYETILDTKLGRVISSVKIHRLSQHYLSKK